MARISPFFGKGRNFIAVKSHGGKGCCGVVEDGFCLEVFWKGGKEGLLIAVKGGMGLEGEVVEGKVGNG